eukprot:gene2090-479_t
MSAEKQQHNHQTTESEKGIGIDQHHPPSALQMAMVYHVVDDEHLELACMSETVSFLPKSVCNGHTTAAIFSTIVQFVGLPVLQSLARWRKRWYQAASCEGMAVSLIFSQQNDDIATTTPSSPNERQNVPPGAPSSVLMQTPSVQCSSTPCETVGSIFHLNTPSDQSTTPVSSCHSSQTDLLTPSMSTPSTPPSKIETPTTPSSES